MPWRSLVNEAITMSPITAPGMETVVDADPFMGMLGGFHVAVPVVTTRLPASHGTFPANNGRTPNETSPDARLMAMGSGDRKLPLSEYRRRTKSDPAFAPDSAVPFAKAAHRFDPAVIQRIRRVSGVGESSRKSNALPMMRWPVIVSPAVLTLAPGAMLAHEAMFAGMLDRLTDQSAPTVAPASMLDSFDASAEV